jgi:hypothetical protein
MINYEYKVAKLHKRHEINGFADVITSVTIHYVASQNGKETIARCTCDFDFPNPNGKNTPFVPYGQVTSEMMIEWTKKRIDYTKFNADLERQLTQANEIDEVTFN